MCKELQSCEYNAPAARSYSQTLHHNIANLCFFLQVHHECVTQSYQRRLIRLGSWTWHLASHQTDANSNCLFLYFQVYYEDLDNGDRMQAYCNLVHCYSLPDDQGLWVEHGYFDDRYARTCCPVHGHKRDITSGP